MEKYVCGICGKTHYDLEEYLICVAKCGAQVKKQIEEERNKKRLEAVNKALNAIKQAENYCSDLKNKFKEDYPEEYKLNFGAQDCDCDCNKEKESVSKTIPKTESIELSYERNGKEEPKMIAKVNGKQVSDDYIQKLFEDPETKYIAQLLGIL